MKISPCLWFDSEAEEAARFYAGIFKKSRISAISCYPEAGKEIHGRAAGSVMTVKFELEGQPFTALNGGPVFKFNEAISFMIYCDSQEEIDRYTAKLSSDPKYEQCGWIKDKFGMSWQIVPRAMDRMMKDPDPKKVARVVQAFLPMKKFDIAALERAYEGR